jgi:hypothetical protein
LSQAIRLAVVNLAVTAAGGQPPGPPGPIPLDAAQALSQLPSVQLDLAGGGRAIQPMIGSPISARSYTGALSDIGKDKKCHGNGSHGQGGSGC